VKVLLDTNIVLDVLLARDPWLDQAKAIWLACDDGRLEGWVSAVTLTTIFYVGQKQLGKSKAREAVAICLKVFQICPIHRQTIDLAMGFNGMDFEDDMQCACASLASLDAIVTRDASGFAASPIVALTPLQLLARLESGE
jgi:predicted nucleic acid-binding protein